MTTSGNHNITGTLSVSTGSLTPTLSSKAAIQVDSINKGILGPRMTSAQRIAIAPGGGDESLRLYDLTTQSYWFWNGAAWVEGSGAASPNLYTTDSTIGSGRVATLTDTWEVTNADTSSLLLFDGTNKRISIGGSNVSSSAFSVRGASTVSAGVTFVFANSVGSRMMQGNDAGNISIGLGAPLTNSRLYVHSVNSTLFYGLNVLHSRNAAGTAANQMSSLVGNGFTGNAYNYFVAGGTNGYSRAVFANATKALSTTNVGVYANVKDGTVANYAMHANISGGGTTVVSALYYGENINTASLQKHGVYTRLLNGNIGSINYGLRTYVSPLNGISTVTLYGGHIQLDCNVSNTSLTQIGLFIDVNNRAHTTPVLTRAIHTQRGDIRFEDLSGTGDRPVMVDSTGVLKATGSLRLGAYTVATLPTASTSLDEVIIVTDETGGRTLATSDGTNWRRVRDGLTVA